MLNSINTNIGAYFAQANIGKANQMSTTSIGRLSSGERIVNASDDVAGLAAGTSLATTVTTLRAALTNASQGSSLLQVADGALAEVTDILQRQKSLAVQAGSGSLTDVERGFLDQEFQALSAEIDRISESTSFNGVGLLNGTGVDYTLASTNAIAVGFDPTSAAAGTAPVDIATVNAIAAINVATNTDAEGNGAGQIQFVQSDGTTQLTNGEYLSVSNTVVGAIEDLRIEQVQFGIAAVAVVEINGQTFSGAFADGDTNVVVSNGNTRIDLGTGALTLTDESTVANSVANALDGFADVEIMRTSVVAGVNFAGTRLEGVTGAAATGGVAMVRLNAEGSVNISNFRYLGNTGANNNTIAVDVNGQTFTGNVNDALAAGDVIAFTDGQGQGLQIDLTGLDNDFGQGTNDDIRQDLGQREAFINALNIGFGRAGGGLDFAVGENTSDVLNVQIDAVNTSFLYGGASLNLASASSAAAASEQLDFALEYITAVRADVGAVQSRFNFASASVEVAVQNQDAARAVFLDTDVAAESTSFATSQVQLQAGISVLAQANLLSQNLLKLIG